MTELTVRRVRDSPDSRHSRISLPTLPNDLLRDVADFLSIRDLKNVRGVCSRLEDFASPLIFTTAVCAARRGVFEAFKALSNHPKLNQHVTELVYDNSFLDYQTVKRFKSYAETHDSHRVSADFIPSHYARKTYKEQKKILGSELSSALESGIRRFSNLRRIIYADFGRLACFQNDRFEDLGPAFRLGHIHVPEFSNRVLQYPLLQCLRANTPLRSMYLGLAVLLRALFRPDCKTRIEDLQIGDNKFSHRKDGIPDTLFMALFDGSYGLSSALFDTVRKLDITFTYCTRRDHAKALTRFGNLELLRIVGPFCSPDKAFLSPSLNKPVVRFGENGLWPQLRALELKWVSARTVDLLSFFQCHKDTLQFVKLYEVHLRDKTKQWCSLVSSLRSIYPTMTVEPNQRSWLDHHHVWRVIHFTLFNGQAELVDMGVYSSLEEEVGEVDNCDEDMISDFHDSDKSDPEEERWSSEELDYSEDGALPDRDTSDGSDEDDMDD
ncbi:MAG: hypothetical protein Q9168_003699 [Polycauliona sp. 1 TL-2023]